MVRNIFLGLFATSILMWASCDSDPINCEDKQIGEVFSDAAAKAFLPFDGTEKLIFRNEADSELVFLCLEPNIQRIKLNVEKLCEGLDLSAHFKVVLGDAKKLVFTNSVSDRIITLESNRL